MAQVAGDQEVVVTPKQALDIARELHPTCASEAAELILTACTAEDQGERECAAGAFASLPERPLPERPPLPDPSDLRGRLTLRLGRSFTLMAAVAEIIRWVEPLKDAELESYLRRAYGHLLSHVMAAKAAVGAL